MSTWRDIIAVSRAFHRAVAPLRRPAVLDGRRDRWAEADRVAWGEQTVRFLPELADLARRLGPGIQPLGRPQLVHGDLAGNILFDPGRPPAVIDISPYWRPLAYAEGIVVADALCWHDAPPSLHRTLGVPPAAVARALLFRMATTNARVLAADERVDLRDEVRRYARAAAALGL
ncbi:phosphotransferase [Actinoplanes sp. OR16]|uniref:phosphotransferase n=1 Tax=Actinoplanes sp. OR16 TaxID=946334 RepID=UPI000FD9318C|nr:phosphotransferase [Actinoplanes sp. OR16]